MDPAPRRFDGSAGTPVQPFGGPMAAAKRARDLAAGAPQGAAAGDLLQPGKLRAYLSGVRSVVSAPNSAAIAPASPAEGLGVPGVLNDFRFREGARAADRPVRLPPAMGRTERQTNTPTSVQRTLYPMGKGTIMSLPGQDELVILRRSKPRSPNYRLSMRQTNMLGHAGLYDTPLAYRSENPMLMQAEPCFGFHLQAWNFAAVQKQYDMYVNDRDAYDALTPAKIWYGSGYGGVHADAFSAAWEARTAAEDAPDWCGFSLDGIALIEETGDGRSARDADGYDRHSSLLGRDRPTGPGAHAKVYTVTTGGQQDMLDVTEGRGVCEGARAHLVLIKFPLEDQDGTMQRFVLAHKAAPLGLPVAGATELFPPEPGLVRGHMRADDVHPFRPYMLAAVMTPDGGPLDPAYLEYDNERGERCYDGLCLTYGTVLFAPEQFQYQPPLPPGALRPVTNGYQLMLRGKLTLLLQPYKDGGLRGW